MKEISNTEGKQLTKRSDEWEEMETDQGHVWIFSLDLNVFFDKLACFTKSSMQLEWLDLPQSQEGWVNFGSKLFNINGRCVLICFQKKLKGDTKIWDNLSRFIKI